MNASSAHPLGYRIWLLKLETSLLLEGTDLCLCWMSRYQLDLSGFTSTLGLGFGPQSFKKCWNLFQTGVAHCERWRASIGLVINPLPGLKVMFELERVVSLCF